MCNLVGIPTSGGRFKCASNDTCSSPAFEGPFAPFVCAPPPSSSSSALTNTLEHSHTCRMVEKDKRANLPFCSGRNLLSKKCTHFGASKSLLCLSVICHLGSGILASALGVCLFSAPELLSSGRFFGLAHPKRHAQEGGRRISYRAQQINKMLARFQAPKCARHLQARGLRKPARFGTKEQVAF